MNLILQILLCIVPSRNAILLMPNVKQVPPFTHAIKKRGRL